MPDPELLDKYISILKFGSDANAKSYRIKDEDAQLAINDLNDTINRIKDEIGLVDDGQEQSVSSLQSRVEELEELIGLAASETNLSTRVEDLEIDLRRQKNERSTGSLAEKIKNLDSFIGDRTILPHADTIIGSIYFTDGTVHTLWESVGDYDDQLEAGHTIAGDLSALDTKIDDLESSIEGHAYVNASTVNQLIASSSVATDVSALKTQVNANLDGNNNLTLKGTVADNQERIADLETQVNEVVDNNNNRTLKGTVAELERQINYNFDNNNDITLKGEVTNLERASKILRNVADFMSTYWPSKNNNSALNWTAGGIDPDDGTLTSTANSLRTENFSTNNIIKIIPAAGYKYQIFVYFSDNGGTKRYIDMAISGYDNQNQPIYWFDYALSPKFFWDIVDEGVEMFYRIVVQATDQSPVSAASIDDYIKVYTPITDDDIASF